MACWQVVAAALSVAASASGAKAADGEPGITVIAYNHASVSEKVFARASVDLAEILAAAGLRLVWIDGARGENDAEAAGVRIRLLVRRRPADTSLPVMGTAILDAANCRGSAFVYFDRVLDTAHTRRQDVARVLAYAMAHEVGHLLLAPAGHSPDGVMRASWTGDDVRRMRDGSLRFTTPQEAAMGAAAAACLAR